MKRLFFAVLGFFMLSQGLNAQIRKIPATVTENFKAKYPDAVNVEYKDRITAFSAIFEAEGKKHEAYFTEKGSWKYTETGIEEADLTDSVKVGLEKSKYADWEIKSIYKIEKNDNNTEYRIQIKKGDLKKKNLLFTSDGKLLKDNLTV